MEKLILIGDSFSASTHKDSWTKNLGLPTQNLSTNGSSEYRIWKKIHNADLTKYDFAVIVHTSPNRIYTRDNHLYPYGHTHAQSDLIYTDLENKRDNPFANGAIWWFENVFDIEHAEDMHRLLVADCIQRIKIPCVHLTFFDLDIDNVVNLHQIWQSQPGSINHMNRIGNNIVAKKVDSMIKALYTNTINNEASDA